MAEGRIRALLVEDDPDDALLIGDMLAAARETHFDMRWAQRLAEGLDMLRAEEFDVVILDLSLPDSQGMATLGSVRTQVPRVPIVVLSGLDDLALAVRAVGGGAQDYLLKGQVNAGLLSRAVRYAVERQHLETALDQAEQWKQRSSARLQSARDLRYYAAMSREVMSAPGGPDNVERMRELASQYHDLVVGYIQSDRALALRPLKRLQELAENMAQAGARACDVMRLHLDLVNKLGQVVEEEERPAIMTDLRLVLLDLMGSLADTYRSRWQRAISCGGKDGGEGRDRGPAG